MEVFTLPRAQPLLAAVKRVVNYYKLYVPNESIARYYHANVPECGSHPSAKDTLFLEARKLSLIVLQPCLVGLSIWFLLIYYFNFNMNSTICTDADNSSSTTMSCWCIPLDFWWFLFFNSTRNSTISTHANVTRKKLLKLHYLLFHIFSSFLFWLSWFKCPHTETQTHVPIMYILFI